MLRHVLLLLMLVAAGCQEPWPDDYVPPAPPAPDVEPIPSPVEPIGDGMAMLIVYDVQKLATLPHAQREIIGSTKLRAWLKSNKVKFRFWDDQQGIVGTDAETQAFAKAMKLPRASTPWCYIANGKRSFSGPMPVDEAALMVELEKCLRGPKASSTIDCPGGICPAPPLPMQGDAAPKFPLFETGDIPRLTL